MIEGAILSRTYDAARLPEAGFAAAFEANDGERAALAAAYNLLSVTSLSATATLTPGAGGSVMVEGQVVADIVQACVVTLEPVAQHIDEAFAARFVPAGSPEAAAPARAGREVVVDPAEPDPPEVMDGTAVNLGALVEEIFVLAIDPYPRAPGAELPADLAEAPETGEDSPFAVLGARRRTDG